MAILMREVFEVLGNNEDVQFKKKHLVTWSSMGDNDFDVEVP